MSTTRRSCEEETPVVDACVEVTGAVQVMAAVEQI
jgi:hypothetical protein